MFFLDLNSACSSSVLLIIIKAVKNILGLIQVIGPILAIISLIYTVIMMINNPDEKKYVKRIKNSILALFLVFFVPLIVDVVIGMLGETTKFSDCWNNIDNSKQEVSEYKEVDSNKKKSQIITNPSEYQKSGK